MNLEVIYIDIDGVLNMMPFDALSKVVGYTVTKYPISGNYDIVKNCNTLLTNKISGNDFWKQLDRKFWATMPQTLECNWLPDLCAQCVGRNNVFLLTSPVIDPDCLAGKLEWIYANMPRWLHRQFLIGPHKWLCAKSSALLIDDYDKNIGEFQAYGGQTILVPRPWNSGHTMCESNQGETNV
jgi:5'(3')-deoxyribonucleotidase